MGSTKLLVTGAVIAVAAAAAIVVPAVASGVPLARVLPATSIVAPDDSPGGPGKGNAWGHHKDSPDFLGSNGDHAERGGPGNGNGNGNGKAWGHHKDSPGFPGHNGDRDE
ncbi:hypothetical protein ACWKWN_11230 [Microbacterium trichothecenolyticum]